MELFYWLALKVVHCASFSFCIHEKLRALCLLTYPSQICFLSGLLSDNLRLLKLSEVAARLLRRLLLFRCLLVAQLECIALMQGPFPLICKS